jgi:hypothetical protein
VDDSQIKSTIEELVTEEHQLWDLEGSDGATVADRRRLEDVRVTLDRCWDLLRQRRALREAGRDPDDASTRKADVVEGYEQ